MALQAKLKDFPLVTIQAESVNNADFRQAMFSLAGDN